MERKGIINAYFHETFSSFFEKQATQIIQQKHYEQMIDLLTSFQDLYQQIQKPVLLARILQSLQRIGEQNLKRFHNKEGQQYFQSTLFLRMCNLQIKTYLKVTLRQFFITIWLEHQLPKVSQFLQQYHLIDSFKPKLQSNFKPFLINLLKILNNSFKTQQFAVFVQNILQKCSLFSSTYGHLLRQLCPKQQTIILDNKLQNNKYNPFQQQITNKQFNFSAQHKNLISNQRVRQIFIKKQPGRHLTMNHPLKFTKTMFK